MNSSMYFLIMSLLWAIIILTREMSDLRPVRCALFLIGFCLFFSIVPLVEYIGSDDESGGMKFFAIMICMFAPIAGIRSIYTSFLSADRLRDALKDVSF